MTYQQERDAEQRDYINDAITDFISRYSGNLSNTHRKTVILFPGAMGSQFCGPARHSRTGRLTPTISCGSTAPSYSAPACTCRCRAISTLMSNLSIPDGPVYFPPLTPYQGFINWCDQQQIDYLIFGWDWRRDPSLTADFFLNVFMPLFKQRVAGLQPSPLQTSVVGRAQLRRHANQINFEQNQ